MRFKLFSVVVGTEACVASCPFCVSSEPCNTLNKIPPVLNVRNLRIGANLANRSGVDTVMLTSRGEPTLFPDTISNILSELKPSAFPFVELQTNALPLASNWEKYASYLDEWYYLGLTTIAISVVSYDAETNRQIYTPHKDSYMDLPGLIKRLHTKGFSVRLTCICCKGIMDIPQEVVKFLQFAKDNQVEQVTLRPLNEEYRRQSAHDWIEEHKLTLEQKLAITSLLETEGTPVLVIDRVGTVYDFYGQNVCFSVPLTINTRDTNPDNGRQLIYFPDGHLRYEWEKEGAILL